MGSVGVKGDVDAVLGISVGISVEVISALTRAEGCFPNRFESASSFINIPGKNRKSKAIAIKIVKATITPSVELTVKSDQ